MQHVIEVRAGAELLVDVAQCGFPMIDEKGIANSSSPKSSLTFRQQVRQSRKVGAASKRPGNVRLLFVARSGNWDALKTPRHRLHRT